MKDITNKKIKELFIQFLKDEKLITKYKKALVNPYDKDIPKTFHKGINYLISKMGQDRLILTSFTWHTDKTTNWSKEYDKWKDCLKENNIELYTNYE